MDIFDGPGDLDYMSCPSDSDTSFSAAKVDVVRVAGVRGKGGRKCGFCGVAESVLWRSAPLGFDILCNPCGLAFKRGRIVLEAVPGSCGRAVPRKSADPYSPRRKAKRPRPRSSASQPLRQFPRPSDDPLASAVPLLDQDYSSSSSASCSSSSSSYSVIPSSITPSITPASPVTAPGLHITCPIKTQSPLQPLHHPCHYAIFLQAFENAPLTTVIGVLRQDPVWQTRKMETCLGFADVDLEFSEVNENTWRHLWNVLM